MSDHTLDVSSSSILAREEDKFKRRVREAIEIFCQDPTLNRVYSGPSSPRSIETFCYVIHSVNQVTKHPNPSLEKGSAMELNACV